MDNLDKLAASGGNDIFPAGTFKFLSLDVATITLTGTVGTATVTVNGLAKVATFATSLAVTAANFMAANKDAYAALDIDLTNSGDTIVFTSMRANLKISATIANLVTDLAGTVVLSKNEGTDNVVFTLSATGTNKGLITVNGLSKVFTWDTNVGTTSAAFVAANAAAYKEVGVNLTGTVTLIFTARPGQKITDYSVRTITGDATATIARTLTKLPLPVYALGVFADAVLTSYKYIDDNGLVKIGYDKKFLTQTIAVGSPVLIFKYPAIELVIASGSFILNFVK